MEQQHAGQEKTVQENTVQENTEKEEGVTSNKIVLYPYQVDHVKRLKNILSWSPFALDFSMLGTGKTYTSSYIALDPEYSFKHVIVIAPVSVNIKWNDMKDKYNIPIIHSLSFNGVRSVKGKQPKHGLLHRRDYTVKITDIENNKEEEIHKVEFSITESYSQLVKEGLLLIMDEIQNVKNITSQFQACQTLIKGIVDSHSTSKILLLSGSPVDKKEQVINLFKTLCICKQNELAFFNPNLRELRLKGMNDILDYAVNLYRYKNKEPPMPLNEISRKESDGKCFICLRGIERNGMSYRCIHKFHSECIYHWKEIGKNRCPQCRMPLSRIINTREDKLKYRSIEDIRKHCYELFQDILKPHLSSSMVPSETNTDSTLYKYNSNFHILNSYDNRLLTQSVQKLSMACGYNSKTKTIDFSLSTSGGFGKNKILAALAAVNSALRDIERAKIRTIARITKQTLTSKENEKAKVVICVNYTQSIFDLVSLLKEFSPLILHGQTSMKARKLAIENFQEGNSNYRLLIGNLQVCSTGIDLDDKYGQFPRIVYANPNYNTITLYQLGHRFQRADTKSDAIIHFVFGKHAEETSILNCLARKSKVMKQTTEEQVNAGVVFPGDYETYDEK